MDQKKKFKKPVKDSIVIAKSNKYSIEANEQQRERCLLLIYVQIIVEILLISLEIVYLIRQSLTRIFVLITLASVNKILQSFLGLYLIIDQNNPNQLDNFSQSRFTSKNYRYVLIEDIIYKRELVISLSLIIGFILQSLKITEWAVQLLPGVILISLIFFTTIYENYMLRNYIFEYLQFQSNFNLRRALLSQEAFEQNLKKSMESKRTDSNRAGPLSLNPNNDTEERISC